MFIYESKDELFLFLARFSKIYGINYLNKYWNILDKALPLVHSERFGITFEHLNTLENHESGINQII